VKTSNLVANSVAVTHCIITSSLVQCMVLMNFRNISRPQTRM